MALHLGYCKDFGLSKEDVEREDENQGMTDKMPNRHLISSHVF